MQTRHQHAPRRRTNIRPRIKLIELHPLRGDPINIRRPNLRLPITPTMPPPQIIRHDEDDVRRSRLSVNSHSRTKTHTEAQSHREKMESPLCASAPPCETYLVTKCRRLPPVHPRSHSSTPYHLRFSSFCAFLCFSWPTISR